MNRRDVLTTLSMAGGATLLPKGHAGRRVRPPVCAMPTRRRCAAPTPSRSPTSRRSSPRRTGIRLVVVKVLTSEPGLYGLGCATFTQRALRRADRRREVPEAVPDRPQRRRDRGHLAVVLRQLVLAERPGPVQRHERRRHGALGHQGQAGRHAGLPAAGRQVPVRRRPATPTPAAATSRRWRTAPRRRWSRATATSASRSASPAWRPTARATAERGSRRQTEAVGPTNPDARSGSRRPTAGRSPKLFEHLRATLGDDVELLHDVHERISPSQAVKLCKDLEQYHLFFLEDPFSPEDKDHFRLLRQQSSIPIAMGELFNTQQEYVPLIADRLIDFIRIHISQIGGLSMARKVAALCEFFGVRTAWHGPGDVSPRRPRRRARARAGQLQLRHPRGRRLPGPRPARSSPAAPRSRTATCYANEAPGLGIDLDEKLAAKFPFPDGRRPSITAGARPGGATAR